MEILLTFFIGICLLVVFILCNLGVYSIFAEPEDSETRKGCGVVLLGICVVIAILYGLRSCVS